MRVCRFRARVNPKPLLTQRRFPAPAPSNFVVAGGTSLASRGTGPHGGGVGATRGDDRARAGGRSGEDAMADAGGELSRSNAAPCAIVRYPGTSPPALRCGSVSVSCDFHLMASQQGGDADRPARHCHARLASGPARNTTTLRDHHVRCGWLSRVFAARGPDASTEERKWRR
jgi:hypothetical protein